MPRSVWSCRSDAEVPPGRRLASRGPKRGSSGHVQDALLRPLILRSRCRSRASRRSRSTCASSARARTRARSRERAVAAPRQARPATAVTPVMTTWRPPRPGATEVEKPSADSPPRMSQIEAPSATRIASHNPRATVRTPKRTRADAGTNHGASVSVMRNERAVAHRQSIRHEETRRASPGGRTRSTAAARRRALPPRGT